MLEGVAITLGKPSLLYHIDDFLAVTDVGPGAMVDISVLLFTGVFSPIIPKEAGQAVSLGGLDDVFHVIEIELPGSGVGFGSH